MSRKCKYTRSDIQKKLSDSPCECLYQSEVVKYRSSIKDGTDLVMDVIAEWLLEGDHFKEWMNTVQQYSVRRAGLSGENAYNIIGEGHYTDPDAQKSSEKHNEVWLAKKLWQMATLDTDWFRSDHSAVKKSHQPALLGGLGMPLNFEVPLSDNTSSGIKPIADAIDLVTYDKKSNTLYLVELKQPRNKRESLLRCIVEVFTYYLLIKDKRSFVRDFAKDRNGLPTGVREDTRVSIAVLVPPTSVAGRDLKQYGENEDCLPKVKLLVAAIERELNRDWKSDDMCMPLNLLNQKIIEELWCEDKNGMKVMGIEEK